MKGLRRKEISLMILDYELKLISFFIFLLYKGTKISVTVRYKKGKICMHDMLHDK